MPVLPSGRYVEIMPERARYHAARLKLRITGKTPHQQLYPLVDILLAERADGEASEFSGYTLASRGWINSWPEEDRDCFYAWLQEPEQVRRIEQARRRLLAEETLPRERSYPYPQRLYSLLQRRIEAMPMGRAPARQWRKTLQNLQRRGVRREELLCSGLPAFLDSQPPGQVIERERLLAALDFRAVRPRLINELECDQQCRLPFHEVAQLVRGYRLQLAGLPVDAEALGVIRYCSTAPAYRIGKLWPRGRGVTGPGAGDWFLLGPVGQAIGRFAGDRQMRFSSHEEAMARAEAHALRNHHRRCSLVCRNKYGYMSLDGGEDYREWLVTLPDYRHTHFSGHFFERNILMHIRSKVRVAQDGTRVLFIEELQSDWQQAWLRVGSRGGVPMAPFRKEWASLGMKLMLLHAVEQGLDAVAWTSASVHEQRYDQQMPALRRLYDTLLPALMRRLARPWGVAPEMAAFRTRQPWLHAARGKRFWKVEGGGGKFSTRARYSKEEALALIARHSKAVTLQFPVVRLNRVMREAIAAHGLPLFGEQHGVVMPADERGKRGN